MHSNAQIHGGLYRGENYIYNVTDLLKVRCFKEDE